MAKYLSPTEAENIFILHDTSDYHTHAGQVLTDPVINFVQLPSGDVGYKISNTEEINISLCSNPLYLAAQKKNPSHRERERERENERERERMRERE